jgi:ribosome-binding factor A
MSRDLSHATVFISVYGDEKTQKEAMEAIEHAKGFIRYETVQEINLRVAPELSFKLDNTLNNALRMEALIDKTIKEDEARRLAREEKNGTKEEGGEEA